MNTWNTNGAEMLVTRKETITKSLGILEPHCGNPDCGGFGTDKVCPVYGENNCPYGLHLADKVLMVAYPEQYIAKMAARAKAEAEANVAMAQSMLADAQADYTRELNGEPTETEKTAALNAKTLAEMKADAIKGYSVEEMRTVILAEIKEIEPIEEVSK